MDLILNGLTLAYLGDAYYELRIRQHLIDKKLTKGNDLHRQAIRYTSSVAQAYIANQLIEQNVMRPNEYDAFKKGRNFSGAKRKNVDPQTYHLATGFEALLGMLFYEDTKRLDEFILFAIAAIEKED